MLFNSETIPLLEYLVWIYHIMIYINGLNI